MSGAIGYLSQCFQLEPLAIGWGAGCALIRCLLDSATAAGLADRFGLKRALADMDFENKVAIVTGTPENWRGKRQQSNSHLPFRPKQYSVEL